jgi:hypothetical protein
VTSGGSVTGDVVSSEFGRFDVLAGGSATSTTITNTITNIYGTAVDTLGLVEIQDSHAGLVVIQALDGSIRTD